MNRRLLLLTTFSVLVLSATNCSKAKAPQLANRQGEAQDAAAWKVTLKSNCANGVAEQCVAAYGFSVDANGRFSVGPGPQGQIQAGAISSEEFKALDGALAEALSGAHLESAESCKALEEATSDSEDTVTLIRQDREQKVLQAKANELCFQTATAEAAEALHNAIRTLAQKYYAVPFPDGCADAAAAVQALYPELQTCTADADCAYINSNYDPIGDDSMQYVITDDCTVVKPLAVGNAQAVTKAQGKLSTALQNAYNACAERINRPECTSVTGFQSNQAKPVCQQGYCRVNPSIGAGGLF